MVGVHGSVRHTATPPYHTAASPSTLTHPIQLNTPLPNRPLNPILHNLKPQHSRKLRPRKSEYPYDSFFPHEPSHHFARHHLHNQTQSRILQVVLILVYSTSARSEIEIGEGEAFFDAGECGSDAVIGESDGLMGTASAVIVGVGGAAELC